jgi:hypothetical protein
MKPLTKRQKLCILNSVTNFIQKDISKGICIGFGRAIYFYGQGTYLYKQFKELFTPDSIPSNYNFRAGLYFNKDDESKHEVSPEQAKSDRLLALSFMYSMVEAGDL